MGKVSHTKRSGHSVETIITIMSVKDALIYTFRLFLATT